MNTIVRPITEDKLVGFDEFNQLLCIKQEHGYQSGHFVTDVRGKTCALCGRGWEMTGPSFGDQLSLRVPEKMVHESCYRRHQAMMQHQEVYYALVNAKIRFNDLREVPNQYWAPTDMGMGSIPWFEADCTDLPLRFTIGHRKRVWSIELRGTDGGVLPNTALTKAFESEDVTKEFYPTSMLIHAWGTDKMKDYLKTISSVIGLDEARPR